MEELCNCLFNISMACLMCSTTCNHHVDDISEETKNRFLTFRRNLSGNFEENIDSIAKYVVDIYNDNLREEAMRLSHWIYCTEAEKNNILTNELLFPDVNSEEISRVNNRIMMGRMIWCFISDETKNEIISSITCNSSKNRAYDSNLKWLYNKEINNKKNIIKGINCDKWTVGISSTLGGGLGIAAAFVPGGYAVLAGILSIIAGIILIKASVSWYKENKRRKNVENTVKQINTKRIELGFEIEKDKNLDEDKRNILGDDGLANDAVERSEVQMNQRGNQQNQINLPLISYLK